jgi:hypothetical protein
LGGANSSTMFSHFPQLSSVENLTASQPPVQKSVQRPHRMSPCFPDVAFVSCFGLWGRSQVSFPRSLVQSTVCGWWPTSAGTHHLPSPFSTAP